MSIALIEAYRAGLLGRQHWLPNIVSGIVVGVIALPLAMAFAIASGAQPEQGLYTAIIAGILAAIFGGSRLQITGPTGAFIVILSSINAQYGMLGLQIATIMAGVILILLGVARLGMIIKFIPTPVILGFTSGIAVIIWVGQWHDFFGLPQATTGGTQFYQKFMHALSVLPQFHLPTLCLASLALIIILFTHKIPVIKRIPGPVVALVLVTLIAYIHPFEGVRTIGSVFGGVPSGLPDFHMPEINLPQLIHLVEPAFAIAMLGALESLLSAVVADGMAGTKHNSNQELIGQGIANCITPLFGGITATGAIARTAANIRNGGTSPLSGIVHGLTLIFIMLVLAPLARHIPLAVLSAILFVVAWNMSEAKHFFKTIRRAPRADVAILLITFTLTVVVDLVVAVNIGVIIATLYFLHRMATSVEVRQATASELAHEFATAQIKSLPEGVLVYIVEGPFFFGAVGNFERALEITHTLPKILIIRLRWVPFIDLTGLQTLEEVIQSLHKRHVQVMLSGANEAVRRKLRKAGIVDLIEPENYFEHFTDALIASKHRLKLKTT